MGRNDKSNIGCYNGKRLLLLGGSNNIQELKEFQNKTGITYCATYDDSHCTSPFKTIAAEIYHTSPMDREGLIRLVHENRIDGLFVGGNEKIIPVAIDVADRCGLPFYVTKEQWKVTANKARFKHFCAEFSIPVVEGREIGDDLFSIGQIKYPVIMKPVDACGGEGVTLCQDEEVLRNSYQNVLRKSKCGEVLVESYETGTEIVVYYTLNNGEMSLSSICDRYNIANLKGMTHLPDAWVYPSVYTDLYVKKYNQAMIKMFLDGLKLKNGVLGVQGFAYKDSLVFFEMGYRLGGTSQFRYTNVLNGINSFDLMLTYALGGDTSIYKLALDNPYFKKPCCTLPIMLRPGVIGNIGGVERCSEMHQVICLEMRHYPGEEIRATGTLDQTGIWVWIVGDNISDLKNVIREVKSILKVYDTNGENMIISDFNPNRIEFAMV